MIYVSNSYLFVHIKGDRSRYQVYRSIKRSKFIKYQIFLYLNIRMLFVCSQLVPTARNVRGTVSKETRHASILKGKFYIFANSITALP